MHYFYFDAAGDPGFQVGKTVQKRGITKAGGGSKPFYVLCVLSTDNKNILQDKLIELRYTLSLSPTYEFKYHTLDVSKRQPFFSGVVGENFKAFVSVLDKIRSPRRGELSYLKGNELTNRLVAPMLTKAINSTSLPITKFHFTIDQAKHDKKIADNMRAEISLELKRQNILCRSQVSPRASDTEDCLQLADMIAGMVMDSYETSNKSLINVLGTKLEIEDV